MASAALVGAIMGQVIAGSMADIIGRKRIFVATAALITIGSIGSACSLDTPSLTIYGQICCWRFILGAGVGGEYPLAATVTSESSSAGKRGSLMSAVFAMQGVGALLSGIVVYLCLYLGFSNAFTWRFALAFGAVPVMIAFPYRLRMHETESFERLKQERAATSQQYSRIATNDDSVGLSSHDDGRDYALTMNNDTPNQLTTPGGGNGMTASPLHPTYQSMFEYNLNSNKPSDNLNLPPMATPSSGAKGGAEGGRFVTTADGQFFYQTGSAVDSSFDDDSKDGKSKDKSPHNKDTNIPLFGGTASTASPASHVPLTAHVSMFAHQADKNRSNSIDITDDYGLYHVDSRHNSNNYAQMQLMHHTQQLLNEQQQQQYGNNANVRTYNESDRDVYNPSLASGSTDRNASLSNVAFLSKIQSRRLLSSKNAGIADPGEEVKSNAVDNEAYTRNSLAYPAPRSSIQQHRYQYDANSQQSDQRAQQLKPPHTAANTAMNTNGRHNASTAHAPAASTAGIGAEGNGHLQEMIRAFRLYHWHILGTALSWFLLDVDFYANGLFNHEITAHIFTTTATAGDSASRHLLSSPNYVVNFLGLSPFSSFVHPLDAGTSVPMPTTTNTTTPLADASHAILLSLVAIPGYLLAVLFIEKVGRKQLQVLSDEHHS